eukprot:2343289-Prorocentrum_lima.AAC.1
MCRFQILVLFEEIFVHPFALERLMDNGTRFDLLERPLGLRLLRVSYIFLFASSSTCSHTF